ncbi:hypothetical protein SAY86_016308 [Trapa natans]|uniref:DEK-C domain-containing protein n=1 Tax=Trapa natans TaxID=22666 RepID=A0AAN7QZB9_TRANT|nr:hypothetical protein SAY86_016308 [Trapa natans]
MDPPPALTAPEHEEDEWDKDGFVIPSLEIEGAVPAEQDDPNSQTLVATSQMAKKEESIYLGPHGAPPSMSKQQSPNSSNNRKQRFKQKLREAEKKFGGGSGRENKVENLRELVGAVRFGICSAEDLDRRLSYRIKLHLKSEFEIRLIQYFQWNANFELMERERQRSIGVLKLIPCRFETNQSSDASKRGSKKANYHSDISEDEEEHETDEEKAVNGISEEFDHEMHDRSESGEESSSEDESEEDTGKKKKQNSSNRKQSAGKPKSSRKSSPQSKTPKRLSSSKRGKVDDDDDDDEASSTPRKKNESSISAKSASKMKTGKKTEKGKDKEKNEKAGPSTRKLRDAICEILKKVDFNTATFTDILKLLAKKFDTDLTPRKAAIKLMIQGELQKLADDADDDEEEAGEVVEKEEMAIDNTKVKA